MILSEADVSLTDFALAVLCGLLAFRFDHRNRHWRRFFGAVGLSAFIAGLVHGFFFLPSSLGDQFLWPLSLMLIGYATYQVGAIQVYTLIRVSIYKAWPWLQRLARLSGRLLFLSFVIYCLVIFFVSQRFWVAVAYYAPFVMIWSLIAILYWVSGWRDCAFSLAMSVGLSCLAAWAQQARWGIHPIYMSYNATYHLLQGLGLIFLAQYAERSAHQDFPLSA